MVAGWRSQPATMLYSPYLFHIDLDGYWRGLSRLAILVVGDDRKLGACILATDDADVPA